MPGATDDGGEDSTRGVVSGESGFAHTGSVINNECGDFIFHGWTIEEGKMRYKLHTYTSVHQRPYDLNLTSCELIVAAHRLCRWVELAPHIPTQPDKRKCAAFCYYHIRTWLVLSSFAATGAMARGQSTEENIRHYQTRRRATTPYGPRQVLHQPTIPAAYIKLLYYNFVQLLL